MNKRIQKIDEGITLIALVITIIVLLILVGVSISMLTGENGLLNRAVSAKDTITLAEAKEQVNLAMMASYGTNGRVDLENLKINLNKIQGITGVPNEEITQESFPINVTIKDQTVKIINSGEIIKIEEVVTAPDTPENPVIPNDLKIGSIVSYTPNGTYNEWTTTNSGYGDLSLDSSTDNYKITTWKVYNIDNKTGKVELVPTSATKGKVWLRDANGYNNCVKLLNDACSNLYGNTEKGITARSINITDIENKLDYDPTTYVNSNVIVELKYKQQYPSAYTFNKLYPNIHENEHSVINEIENIGTLDLSDQEEFVTGLTDAEKSIQPYQTYYTLSYDNFNSKLKSGYASLLLPSDATTEYLVASRCVNLYSNRCTFGIYNVYNGELKPSALFGSENDYWACLAPIFPIVSLDSNLIEGDSTSGYSIK